LVINSHNGDVGHADGVIWATSRQPPCRGCHWFILILLRHDIVLTLSRRPLAGLAPSVEPHITVYTPTYHYDRMMKHYAEDGIEYYRTLYTPSAISYQAIVTVHADVIGYLPRQPV